MGGSHILDHSLDAEETPTELQTAEEGAIAARGVLGVVLERTGLVVVVLMRHPLFARPL